MKVAIGTLFAASLAHILMRIPELVYFIFTFPAVPLILVAFIARHGPLPRLPPDRAVPLQGLLKD